jgi:hypothetical protein
MTVMAPAISDAGEAATKKAHPPKRKTVANGYTENPYGFAPPSVQVEFGGMTLSAVLVS